MGMGAEDAQEPGVKPGEPKLGKPRRHLLPQGTLEPPDSGEQGPDHRGILPRANIFIVN